MNNQNQSLAPILIGFSLPYEIETRIRELNKNADLSKINFKNSIPHVTLWMGFVKTKQIESLNLGLHKIFKNVSIETTLNEQELFESRLGKVSSWNVSNVRALELLQNRIHHFFEPFREICKNFEDFSHDTIDYINNFKSKSLENYVPHVTLGFGNVCEHSQEPITIRLEEPKMFLMSNYCTCKEEIQ